MLFDVSGGDLAAGHIDALTRAAENASTLFSPKHRNDAADFVFRVAGLAGRDLSSIENEDS